eukprot:9493387-Pyramimonas_sp.AAC.2
MPQRPVELIPLPRVAVTEVAGKHLSRGARQRAGRGRRAALRVSHAVESLDWLAGCSDLAPEVLLGAILGPWIF